jgi:gluconate 5-dehydrogenase
MRLKDKVAIVTGAASGIGKATANLFVSQGAKVVYSDIHESSEGLELKEGSAFYFRCDVSKKENIEALIKKTLDKFGRLDVMVNNAGIGGLGGILEATHEDWDKTIKINLYGVFYGSQLAAKSMKGKGIEGSIINISSILGTVGMAQTIAYSSSKGGVVQLTHAAALDLAPYNIRINAVAPGFIKTKMTEGVLSDDKFNEMVTNNTPLGHIGEPNDIAQAVLYLASDESKYITGTVLHVDGGWTAR